MYAVAVPCFAAFWLWELREATRQRPQKVTPPEAMAARPRVDVDGFLLALEEAMAIGTVCADVLSAYAACKPQANGEKARAKPAPPYFILDCARVARRTRGSRRGRHSLAPLSSPLACTR